MSDQNDETNPDQHFTEGAGRVPVINFDEDFSNLEQYGRDSAEGDEDMFDPLGCGADGDPTLVEISKSRRV